MILKNFKDGFTLAEVMVTLTLIGVLASMSIPTIGASLQKRARLSEFRAAYAVLESGLKNTYTNKGSLYECYLVDTDGKDMYGYEYGASSSEKTSGCEVLERDFMSTLGFTRKCEGDLNEEGCLPNNYANLGETFKSNRAYVLNNSMLIIPSASKGFALFAVDINGRKGPNRWGQDLFPLSLVATRTEKLSLQNASVARGISVMPPPRKEIEDAALSISGSAISSEQIFTEATGAKK